MHVPYTSAQLSSTAITMDDWLQMHHQPWFPLVEARPDGVFRYTCGERGVNVNRLTLEPEGHSCD